MPAHPGPGIAVRVARFPEDGAIVRGLFSEYAAGLDIDLSFQGFAAELDSLPGAYAQPRGAILLAADADIALGCVAVRPLDGNACEMKRLYVRPAARGRGIGETLVGRICALARERGYVVMRLDTLSSMTSALQLYERAGFRPIPPYLYNPIPDARYLELDLATGAQAATD